MVRSLLKLTTLAILSSSTTVALSCRINHRLDYSLPKVHIDPVVIHGKVNIHVIKSRRKATRYYYMARTLSREERFRKIVPELLYMPESGTIALTMMTSTSPAVRELAALVLTSNPQVEASSVLVRALSDRNPYVRAEVCRAIGARRLSKALPLLRRLYNDKHPSVRVSAILASVDINPRRADPLISLLLNSNDELSITAGGYLLYKRKYTRSREWWVERCKLLLDHKDGNIRASALLGISGLDEYLALEHALRLDIDSDPFVRNIAKMIERESLSWISATERARRLSGSGPNICRRGELKWHLQAT